MLNDSLYHPHSLEIGDFNGNGQPDIFTAEMKLNNENMPRILVYLNDGTGSFEEIAIANPIGAHEAKIGLIGDSKLPSIINKPYFPNRQVDLWLNVTEQA